MWNFYGGFFGHPLCFRAEEKSGGKKIKTKTAGCQQFTRIPNRHFHHNILRIIKTKGILQCESVKRWGAPLSHSNFPLQTIWWSKQTYMSKEQHVSKKWNWFGVSDSTSLQDRIWKGGIPVTDRKLLSEMYKMCTRSCLTLWGNSEYLNPVPTNKQINKIKLWYLGTMSQIRAMNQCYSIYNRPQLPRCAVLKHISIIMTHKESVSTEEHCVYSMWNERVLYAWANSSAWHYWSSNSTF